MPSGIQVFSTQNHQILQLGLISLFLSRFTFSFDSYISSYIQKNSLMPREDVHSRNSSNSSIFLVPLSDITTLSGQLADWKMYVHLRCYSRIIQLHNKLPMKVDLKMSLYWGWATRQDTRGNNATRYAAFAWSHTQMVSSSFNWKSKYNIPFHLSLNNSKLAYQKNLSSWAFITSLTLTSAPWSGESLSQSGEPIHHLFPESS